MAERLARLEGSGGLRIALTVVGFCLSALVIAVSAPDIGPARAAVLQLPSWAFLIAGLVAWRTRPGNRTAVLMTLVGVVVTISGGIYQAESPLLYTASIVLFATGTALVIHFLIAFPSGRLGSRGERAAVGAWYVFALVLTPLVGPRGEDDSCARCPADLNLLADPDFDWLAPAWQIRFVLIAWVVAIGVRRWRRASPPARRVLGPVLLAGVGLALVFGGRNLVMSVAGSTFPETFAPGAPVAEQALNAALYVGAALVPLGFLVGLLRTRVTRSTLGELVVALAAMPASGRLRDHLARALGDDSITLAFHAPALGRYVDERGRPVELPAGEDPSRTVTLVEQDGSPLAGLVHDPALRYEQGLLDSVAAVARLALENERLAAELRARLEDVRESRLRIVAAEDRERRRIERDLHDGAQQRLVSLAVALRLAQGQAKDGEARALLERASEESKQALSELRELAQGLHPQILSQDGLEAALRSLAERSPVPVELEAAPDRRLADSVEACAYFVTSEALQNVAKYAQASKARVRAQAVGSELVLEVADDGVGGAQLGEGSGLVGLRDRVEALEGALELESPPGGGTRLAARIPIGKAQGAPR
jgi:signal transduction histidine kinase